MSTGGEQQQVTQHESQQWYTQAFVIGRASIDSLQELKDESEELLHELHQDS